MSALLPAVLTDVFVYPNVFSTDHPLLDSGPRCLHFRVKPELTDLVFAPYVARMSTDAVDTSSYPGVYPLQAPAPDAGRPAAWRARSEPGDGEEAVGKVGDGDHDTGDAGTGEQDA